MPPNRSVYCCLVVLLLFATSAATPAIAACAPGDRQCRNAEELVQRLDYASSLAHVRNICVQSLSALHPDRAVAEEPGALLGLTPASPAWPRVLAAFEAFVQEACGGDALAKVLLERYSDSWAKNLNDKQLEAANTFLRSEAGRAFARVLTESHRDVSVFYEERVSAARRAAFARFQLQVEHIAREVNLQK